MGREAGQSTVELVAALPALALAGLIALQLLVTGYALILADGAAEAGALALAAGEPARKAAREALPGWAEEEIGLSVRGGQVTVRIHPPSPLPAIADRLIVSSTAFARPAGDARGMAHVGVPGRSRAEHATLPASLSCLPTCAPR
jgi:hypothetical protein